MPAILALRRDPRLLRVPPYLSALLVLVGIVWLLLLPLDQYSRHTYISENALLPGQVHTYFGGSEQQVFNAYKHEIEDVVGLEEGRLAANISARGAGRWDTIVARLCHIFESAGLTPATQKFEYRAAGSIIDGENVYAVLRAPRGDATEAVVLAAAWTNMDDEVNVNGVALVLTLGRYFSSKFEACHKRPLLTIFRVVSLV